MSTSHIVWPLGVRIGRVLRTVALSGAAVLFLLPFYLLVRNGLATERDIAGPRWTLLPRTWHLQNIVEVFNNRSVHLASSMWNSVVVSVVQTTGTVILAMMAGYGLSRIAYRYANAITGLVLVTLMIPAAVTFMPTFVVVSSLGWVSSLRGLIIPGMFSALAVFLFRAHYAEFPRELEEAGRIDGLGYFGTYWRIVVPNTLAFTAAIATITFLGSWNAFLWPLVIAQDSSSWTAQVALSTYLNAQSTDLGQLFVAAGVTILPVLILFLVAQRFIRQGIESTGING